MTKSFLRAKIREMERQIMNSRQAAKAAAKRIEELEYMVAKQIQDIKDYNRVIQDMIAGESPCLYCEEYDACNLNEKAGKGCSTWWLRYQKEGDNASEGIHAAGGDGQEKTENGCGDEGSLCGHDELNRSEG